MLEQDSQNAKAVYRRAKAHWELGHLTAAEQDLSAALKLLPNDRDCKALQHLIVERNKKYDEQQKQVLKGMFDRT